MRYFVIHVSENTLRQGYVQDMRAAVPELEVCDAVHGSKLTRADIERLRAEGTLQRTDNFYKDVLYVKNRDLSLGELGCYLSHVNVLTEIAQGKDPEGGIVLEDDVILHPDFKKRMRVYLQAAPADREFVKFTVFPNQRSAFPFSDIRLVPMPKGLWGLQCYYMSVEGARKCLARLRPMMSAVDEMITRFGLHQYVVVNDDATIQQTHEHMPSQIQATRLVRDLWLPKAALKVACANFWCDARALVEQEKYHVAFLQHMAQENQVELAFSDVGDGGKPADMLLCSVFGSPEQIQTQLAKAPPHVPRVLFSGENARLRFPAALAHTYDCVLDSCPESGAHPNHMRIPLWLMAPDFLHHNSPDFIRLRQYAVRGPAFEERNKGVAFVARYDFFGLRGAVLNACRDAGVAVDCPSRFGKNVPGIEEQGLTKRTFLEQYLFNICPENSWDEGYVTEKLMDAALAGCIPVYWGGLTEVERGIFNTQRMVLFDNRNAESVAQAGQRIRALLADPVALKAFFEQPVFTPFAEPYLKQRLRELAARFGHLFRKALKRPDAPPALL